MTVLFKALRWQVQWGHGPGVGLACRLPRRWFPSAYSVLSHPPGRSWPSAFSGVGTTRRRATPPRRQRAAPVL